VSWVQQTSGWLTPAERRSLLRPLARSHARNAIGRLAMVVRLNSGRRAYLPASPLVPPSTVLTRAAEDRACGMMPAALVNHSYRSYLFGRALGELEGLEVDDELLFAAAMLHDTGLVNATGDADFTLGSARIARDVAEQVGLSSAASTTMQTAITLHHSPGVTVAAGPVAYLLAAGTGLRHCVRPRGGPRAPGPDQVPPSLRRLRSRDPFRTLRLLTHLTSARSESDTP
jgi:hypothetical protein